ncbi:MAG: TIGR02147 family protein [Bdellovibrionaceae bacterium]|nr:TIGR02147 family protein [Pseudobdellovibrionaceae bacterium]
MFRFHDYRVFLKDWLGFLKSSQSGFSMRALAERAGVAKGYLPMVLSGERALSAKSLAKLAPHLELAESELSYLQALLILTEADSQEERLDALKKMKRFRSFRQESSRELEVYQYLTKWFYVAIREMATMNDFRLEPSWIQARLRVKLSLKEIEGAIEFLTQNGFLLRKPDGSIEMPDKQLECFSGIFRLSLFQFHQQMFDLAADAMSSVPREERHILGHTFALSQAQFDELRRVMEEALKKVTVLGEAPDPKDRLYHFGLFAIPLSQSPKGDLHENAE